MISRKQQLLARHRRGKRIALVLALILLLAVASLDWRLAFPLLLLGWITHEAWFSDHLFYNPRADYDYRFDAAVETLPARLENGCLRIQGEYGVYAADDTLLLAIRLESGGWGRLRPPAVDIETAETRDCQTFEFGASGLRYLNLTGLAAALAAGEIRLRGRRCAIGRELRLLRVRHPDYRQQRLLIIAPHADDAELAAFGLYSQAREVWIVTLTAGEIEAENYQGLGLSAVEAARLKGRLRAWDSRAVPLWGGVPADRCVSLGYFCMQLAAMRKNPETAFASRVADLDDTRPLRQGNALPLPGDADGAPTWKNLLADLAALIERVRPEAIVLPHPDFDPHPDHIAAYAAVRESLTHTDWRPQALLCYANHLHDNDAWPMGEAHTGVPLPPRFAKSPTPRSPWALPLTAAEQIDKACALAMMHDLQLPLPLKRRLRRALQTLLAGRRWPPYGANEYFRKAVRKQEVFWVERNHRRRHSP
ncbi:MAG: PIG-L family deacetylase [Zoogloeaceae bacterium]|nr:PIG-L family deacetylase [Zoogloeaceae bacterium]